VWNAILIIGFLGMIVFAIMGIVSAFKKNGTAKKKFMYAGICFIAFIVGASNVPSGSTTAESNTTTANAPIEDKKPTAEDAAKKKAEEEQKEKEAEEAKKKAEEEAKQKALANKSKYADMVRLMFSNITENKPELPRETYDFIVQNDKLLPAKTPGDIQKAKGIADKSISAKHLNKNASPYFNKMVTFAGKVINVEESKMDNGETFSLIHILDDNMQSYEILMLKSSGDLLQDDTARFWGVPAGPSAFSNVSGGTTNVQLFVGAHVEKITN
jgi:hypothetical protein